MIVFTLVWTGSDSSMSGSGCSLEEWADSLVCVEADLGSVMAALRNPGNDSTLAVIQISKCNISYLPENIFSKSSAVTEVRSRVTAGSGKKS